MIDLWISGVSEDFFRFLSNAASALQLPSVAQLSVKPDECVLFLPPGSASSRN